MEQLRLEDRLPPTLIDNIDSELERYVLKIRELRRSAGPTQRVVSQVTRKAIENKKVVEDAVKVLDKESATDLLAKLIKSMEGTT
jgi:hypothetical protein